MYIGDSSSRNQYQSLICMLHSAVPHANYTTTLEGGVSTFTFTDNGVKAMLECNVSLVDVVSEKIGRVLKLDSIETGEGWKGIDMLIFNTWHWWNLAPYGMNQVQRLARGRRNPSWAQVLNIPRRFAAAAAVSRAEGGVKQDYKASSFARHNEPLAAA
ncbi:hypothetical protein L1049_000839 [Liquidambar formosana]|uniref:Trichome birefringence-like C-terminal domain-containing protein n=1 Tax=Liquidambar formosana TaxID=63359 RepID=A0AAP0R801_LIQFO